MKKYKLLITDLDGTLIETLSGDTFPKGIWDMKIKLYVFEAIKNYAPDDILIISNQGGIEKGFVDKEMFEYKFDYISSALEDYTNISVYNFYCDNNDKDNINRKPNTGMIDQYMDYIKFINDNVDEENKIIYDTIMMIGDASGKEGQFSDSDKKTAENFAIRPGWIGGNTKIANLIVLSNLLAIFFLVILYQLSSSIKIPISVLPRLILIPAS